MIYTIYSLSCPETKSVFYIGVTIRDLKTRLSCHISDAKGYNYPVYKFMGGLTKPPIIEAIEEIDTDDKFEAQMVEKYWIEQFRQWGYSLYNTESNKSIIKYKRTSDEVMYDIYKGWGKKIPSDFVWVEEWLKHPLYLEKKGSYLDIIAARSEVWWKYKDQRYKALLRSMQRK